MANIHKLTDEEIKTAVNKLNGWSYLDNKLHKEIKFDNFVEAFAFMTQIAMEVHLMNHHPEWFNVYNKVVIDLVTHEAGGISNLDIELAEKINSFLE